jgi:carboxymethylenebutenolidase
VGETIHLTSAADGFSFAAWRAVPPDARRGGLVLIHEIFGVTQQIRGQADAFAAEGYETLAPSLFDRLAPGFEASPDAAGVAAGRRYSQATAWDQVAADLAAAVATLSPPVFAVGFCWGGTAAWLAACRCAGLAAVSSYYGRRIPELIGETPRCPIILHFGRRDASIPPAMIEAIDEAHPDLPIHLYDAGHGFAADRRDDYQPDAARLAHLRTLQLFARHGGGRGER